MTGEEASPEERRALFRVVRGEPTPEELAALTVTLAAVAGSGRDETTAVTRDRWSDPADRLRGELRPGPDAWRTSTWPR